MQQNLESYLRENYRRGAIDHVVRCHEYKSGDVDFYIHAQDKDSATLDFLVSENRLTPKAEASAAILMESSATSTNSASAQFETMHKARCKECMDSTAKCRATVRY